jgi:hypothetical protein
VKIEEIEKMLYMMDSDDLISLKEYLLKEKQQYYFEKYCSSPNPKTKEVIQLYCDNYMQAFTKGCGLYIIGGNKFNINTPKIKSLITKGKMKLIEEDTYKKYLNRSRELYGEFDSNWFDWLNSDKYVKARDINIYSKNELIFYQFEKSDLLYAEILLENPEYRISYQNPIMKLESKGGKAYIFGSRISHR